MCYKHFMQQHMKCDENKQFEATGGFEKIMKSNGATGAKAE
jgi:hypothetical protein